MFLPGVRMSYLHLSFPFGHQHPLLLLKNLSLWEYLIDLLFTQKMCGQLLNDISTGKLSLVGPCVYIYNHTLEVLER